MPSKWHEKKEKLAREQFERELMSRPDDTTVNVISEVAMGGGEEAIFEKKLSKEEKKARAKAAREAKRKAKKKESGDEDDDDDDQPEKKDANEVLKAAKDAASGNPTEVDGDDGLDHEQADALAAAGTICTFATSRKGVDSRSRDINVTNFTLQHMGAVMLDETEIVLNHGNRYGLIGRNGCGKSTLLKALGARAVPIPRGIDIFFLDQEVEPSDTMTALDVVMAVDEERLRLEQQAEDVSVSCAILCMSQLLVVLTLMCDRVVAEPCVVGTCRPRSDWRRVGWQNAGRTAGGDHGCFECRI